MGNTESMPPTAVWNHQPQYEIRLEHTGKNVPLAATTEQAEPQNQPACSDEGQEVAAAAPPPPPSTSKVPLPSADASVPGQMQFGGRSEHGVSDLPKCCRGPSEQERFQAEEQSVQKRATHNIFWLALVNGYAALLVFVVHLISLESLFSIALCVVLTIVVYNKTEDHADFDGSMDWVLLSFAVITPMSASVGMSFGRRERALKHIIAMRSAMLQLYSAHAAWDWRQAGKVNSGRVGCKGINWLDHADAALVEIFGICHCLSRFLTLPTATRARHRVTAQGHHEAQGTLSLSSKLYGCMLVRFGRLTDLCEVLKAHGLPPNEATRLRQWERMALENADGLRMIKLYRTPQALRSFARLFTVFLPPFYAPSYAQIARSLGSLPVGIAFSVLTSLALTALFEVIAQMEDPFLGHNSLDGVDVDSELSSSFVAQCLTMRSHFFRDPRPFAEHDVATSTCEWLPVQEFTVVNSGNPDQGRPRTRISR